MVRRSLALCFVTLPTECFVPVSHKLNKDGYFRYRFGGKQGFSMMFHRAVWEHRNGAIRDGHEINHLCNNRSCCNVDHLECITRTEHLVKTNQSRYQARHLAAKSHWEKTNCTGTELAELFGVSYSIGCRWIREWLGRPVTPRKAARVQRHTTPPSPL